MLLQLQQFIQKQANRNSAFILNPRVIRSEQLSLPRDTIIHFLEYTENSKFPSRGHQTLSNIPANKKVPIHCVQDLTHDSKNEVTLLANRTLARDIALWNRANMKGFRPLNLLEVKNTDPQTNAVINYGLLKDLYLYKPSPTHEVSRLNNVLTTLWSTVNTAINVDSTSMHYVRIEIPNLLPSASITENILKLKPINYSRLVAGKHGLHEILELLKYTRVGYKEHSVFKDLEYDKTSRVIVEFQYNGYSSVMQLSQLVSLCDEVPLVNRHKVDSKTFSRYYFSFLNKIQLAASLGTNKVNNVEDNEVDDLTDVHKADQAAVSSDGDDEDESGGGGYQALLTPDEATLKDKLAKVDDTWGVEVSDATDDGVLELTDNDDIFSKLMVGTQDSASTDAEQEEDEDGLPKLNVDYSQETVEAALEDRTIDNKLEEYIATAKASGAVNPADLRALKKLRDNRKTLKSPIGAGTIDEAMVIPKEDLELNDDEKAIKGITNIVEAKYKVNPLSRIDKKYTTKVMHKDILASVANIEKAGVILKNYEVTNEKSALGRYQVHKVTIKPYKGKESTVMFRIPHVDEEGEMLCSGIRYRMRKLRTDLPLRKISPTRVAITSNYGKLFIFRTDRASYDRNKQIVEYIKNQFLENTGVITSVIPGNTFNNRLELPNDLAMLTSSFKSISSKEYTFIIDRSEVSNVIKPEVTEALRKAGLHFLGYHTKDNSLIVMNNNSFILTYPKLEVLGTLPEVIGMEISKLPVQFSMIKILGDNLALGVVMSYYLGLEKLLSVTQTQYEVIPPRSLYKGGDKNAIIIKLEDCKLVIIADTESKRLLFGGFNFYKSVLKDTMLKSLNDQGVYLDIIDSRGGRLMHLKELDSLRDIFIDPITADVLDGMNEPKDYLKLLLRANKLLEGYTHPEVNDALYSRIRGYDRIPGLMYRVLAESVRAHKLGITKNKIELDPYKVWNTILQDTTVKILEENNPVNDVKEMEAGTFSGTDGLSKDATPEIMRSFHSNDIGLVSEATVDSGDTALNFYLTPNAKLEGVRGTVKDEQVEHPSEALSSSSLLAPMVENDDPKRINFISIQNGHTIASEGYMQPLLRTGYEYVMPYRAGALYSVMSEEDAVVSDVTDSKITVKYKDRTQSYKLGSSYGRMEGGLYKHCIVTDRVKGAKLKTGDYICYNDGYFEKDWLDSNRLVMKFNRNVTTCFTLNPDVYEDSSGISKEMAKTFTSPVIKERNFIIEFGKNLIGLKQKGDEVQPNDVLFTVVDENTDFNNLSESSVELLRNLTNLSPKAKVNGKVFSIEMKYNGELSDMSPTLRKLANKLDKEISETTSGTSFHIESNKVSSEYRCEGKSLLPNTLELKLLLEFKSKQAIADKGVIANQMKSVVSNVMEGDVTTESGRKIDVMFSYRSVINRIVLSPIAMGTTCTLIKSMSPRITEAYFG